MRVVTSPLHLVFSKQVVPKLPLNFVSGTTVHTVCLLQVAQIWVPGQDSLEFFGKKWKSSAVSWVYSVSSIVTWLRSGELIWRIFGWYQRPLISYNCTEGAHLITVTRFTLIELWLSIRVESISSKIRSLVLLLSNPHVGSISPIPSSFCSWIARPVTFVNNLSRWKSRCYRNLCIGKDRELLACCWLERGAYDNLPGWVPPNAPVPCVSWFSQREGGVDDYL